MAKAPEPPLELSDELIDKLTAGTMASLHLAKIFRGDDIGEQELVLQFFHLLHARRTSLNPDEVDVRYADFEEQLKKVFSS